MSRDVGEAAAIMNLRHLVVTSVRIADELPMAARRFGPRPSEKSVGNLQAHRSKF